MSDEVKNNTFGKYLGPDFQQKLIWQLLVEPEWCSKMIESISVEYFDDPYLKRIFIIMLEYYNENGKVPNLQNESIYSAIKKYKSPTSEVEGDVLSEKINQIKLWNDRVINKNLLYDGDIVRKETLNFIKQQEYRKIGEYIISQTKNGNLKKPSFTYDVEEKFSKIYNIGDEEDYGTDAVDDIDKALSKEFRETIPTGIEAIDAVTGNGLGKGEIGLILAPSGIGKSSMLTKIANTAFNNGKRVLQIIFEDTIPQIQRKHYTIWSKIKLSDIDENTEIVKERVLKQYNKVKTEKGGKIDIVQFSDENTSLHDIKNWIKRQEKKFGYKYDLIVLDYLDCLEPNRREKDLHSAELSIVKSFIAMASEYNIPCWSAIQTNRSGFNIDIVDAQHSGGNIKRIQKSHLVMSISKPDKEANIANIKMIKARFARDGYEFKDCIFNNDTLEIRITDRKYLNGLNVRKYDDPDLDKTDDKALKLTKEAQNLYHAKISDTYSDGEKIADVVESNKENNTVESDNNDIKPNDEFHNENRELTEKKEYHIPQENDDNQNNKNKEDLENKRKILNEKDDNENKPNDIEQNKESEKNIEDNNQQDNNNNSDDSLPPVNNSLDFLEQMRKQQGDVIINKGGEK